MSVPLTGRPRQPTSGRSASHLTSTATRRHVPRETFREHGLPSLSGSERSHHLLQGLKYYADSSGEPAHLLYANRVRSPGRFLYPWTGSTTAHRDQRLNTSHPVHRSAPLPSLRAGHGLSLQYQRHAFPVKLRWVHEQLPPRAAAPILKSVDYRRACEMVCRPFVGSDRSSGTSSHQRPDASVSAALGIREGRFTWNAAIDLPEST